MTFLSMSSCSSVDRAHACCVWEVIGLIPVRDSDFFLCPMLVSYRSIHLSSITSISNIHIFASKRTNSACTCILFKTMTQSHLLFLSYLPLSRVPFRILVIQTRSHSFQGSSTAEILNQDIKVKRT